MFATHKIYMKSLKSTALIAALALSTVFATSAGLAFTSNFKTSKAGLVESIGATTVPAAGTLEVAFSPNEGGEALIIKVIDSAKTSIDMLSYNFTSAPVVQALINAKKRGVEIRLVADWKSNTVDDRSGKARAALSTMVNAGADVRTIRAYAIHHDKIIIADHETVELGSFNYSDAAARRNSENVLVNWHNPQLAKVYLSHFERNYRQAAQYQNQY